LVEENDIEALSAAMERFTRQQGLLRNFSVNAREEVVAKFSPQAQARELEATYNLALRSA
jgi:glycosyltransferase involved in cell wall biosynthesis